MSLSTTSGLFGNPTRTGVLLALSLLGESHASELSRFLNTTVSNIGKAVDALEQAGVVSGRLIGRTRLLTLNTRYFAFSELEALLTKLSRADASLVDKISSLRKRPRRSRKEL